MAAILQLRRGVITDFSSYGTNLSEPYFDTDRDTIQIGTSNGTGSNADWITLVKLSQANRDFTKSEPNTGSLWIVGDITASDNPNVNLGVYNAISNPNGYDPNSGVLPSSIHSTSSMYLNGNLTASHAWFRRDVRIDGHLIMGDNQPYDVVSVRSEFSGSLIPDNDNYGEPGTSNPLLAYHDLGSNNKRWKNIYLGLGANDFISASNADFSGSVKIDGTLETDDQATLASANIEDLTNNRIVIAGINGELEDDEDFTFDGDDFNIGRDNFQVNVSTGNTFTSGTLHTDGQATLASANVEDLTQTRIIFAGSNGELEDSANLTYDKSISNFTLIGDYYQSGSGASFQFVGAGGEVTGSWTISELAIDNGIVFTNAEGTLDNSSLFTWDGGILDITGGVSASEDLSVGRQAYIQSALIKDLTNDRIVIAGTDGELEDDQFFRFTGNDFIIGSAEHFKVQVSSGNTDISGSVQMYDTLNVDGQSTLASVNVEDLIDNRVVIVGAGGEIEDDGNFTFNGTELNIGTGNFTVQQGSGNTQIIGTLDVDSQSTLSSLNVEDLTSGRIVLVGTSGELEDSGKFTFDQNTNTLTVQGDTNITGDTTISGNLTVSGTTTQLDVANLNVEDKNILIASGAVNATAADGGGITIDGADATILYGSSDDSITINKQLKINGNISGSSFGGTTLLSSSNENFADYSQSVDSRLDTIEGPMSTSLDSRLIEIFATGSDHETRIDVIEGTFSSSLDSRLIEIFSTGSDHETRLDTLEGEFSTSVDSRLDDLETFSGSLDSLYVNETDYSTDSSSFDSRIDAISFDTSSLLTTASIQTSVTGSIIELTKGDSSTIELEIPGRNPLGPASNTYLIPVILTGSNGGETFLDSASFQQCSIIQLKYQGGNGSHNIYLPKASAPENVNRAIRIISNGTVSANDEFYLYASGSDKLDGNSGSLSEFQFDRPYEGIMVWSDGTEWFRVQSKA